MDPEKHKKGESMDKPRDPFEIIFREAGELSSERSEERLKRIVNEHNRMIRDIPPAERIRGIPTGFIDIDVRTSGLPYGLSVVGARPEDGLTDFGINVAMNASSRGYKVLYVNPSVKDNIITKRYLMMSADINPQTLREGEISVEYIREIIKKIDKAINNPNLDFHCNYRADPEDFREVCQRFKEEKGTRLVVLDRLQSLFPPTNESGETYYSIGRRTNSILNEIVSEDGIALLVLCETKKKRGKETISTSHLRDYGALEYGARPIIMFERVPVNEFEKHDPHPSFHGIVANNLEGPLMFEFELGYLEQIGKFYNWYQ